MELKTISPGHYALSVCAALAILTGCGGTTQFPNPVAQRSLGGTGTGFRVTSPSFATPEGVRSDSSGREVLIGKAKEAHCQSTGERTIVTTCNFKVHGKHIARGLYPGTFTAKGTLESEYSYPFCVPGCWSFSESFTITSGATSIVGSILAGGRYAKNIPIPGVYEYTTQNGYSGNVKISALIPHFRETCYGM
jgi:hypothetical protein